MQKCWSVDEKRQSISEMKSVQVDADGPVVVINESHQGFQEQKFRQNRQFGCG
jgi:hypothetical protein